ncbi:hypothetical protein [Sphingomonas endophytica]|uniref:hypothetical protein n=1 Tax=Sphingomonas endophytica TaxID=869719 RepID=UPI00161DDF62|nr:hypothetical protein [Sphingomonas endophytica]
MTMRRFRDGFADQEVGGTDCRKDLVTNGRAEALAPLRRHRRLGELAAGGKGIAE